MVTALNISGIRNSKEGGTIERKLDDINKYEKVKYILVIANVQKIN